MSQTKLIQLIFLVVVVDVANSLSNETLEDVTSNTSTEHGVQSNRTVLLWTTDVSTTAETVRRNDTVEAGSSVDEGDDVNCTMTSKKRSIRQHCHSKCATNKCAETSSDNLLGGSLCKMPFFFPLCCLQAAIRRQRSISSNDSSSIPAFHCLNGVCCNDTRVVVLEEDGHRISTRFIKDIKVIDEELPTNKRADEADVSLGVSRKRAVEGEHCHHHPRVHERQSAVSNEAGEAHGSEIIYYRVVRNDTVDDVKTVANDICKRNCDSVILAEKKHNKREYVYPPVQYDVRYPIANNYRMADEYYGRQSPPLGTVGDDFHAPKRAYRQNDGEDEDEGDQEYDPDIESDDEESIYDDEDEDDKKKDEGEKKKNDGEKKKKPDEKKKKDGDEKKEDEDEKKEDEGEKKEDEDEKKEDDKKTKVEGRRGEKKSKNKSENKSKFEGEDEDDQQNEIDTRFGQNGVEDEEEEDEDKENGMEDEGGEDDDGEEQDNKEEEEEGKESVRGRSNKMRTEAKGKVASKGGEDEIDTEETIDSEEEDEMSKPMVVDYGPTRYEGGNDTMKSDDSGKKTNLRFKRRT